MKRKGQATVPIIYCKRASICRLTEELIRFTMSMFNKTILLCQPAPIHLLTNTRKYSTFSLKSHFKWFSTKIQLNVTSQCHAVIESHGPGCLVDKWLGFVSWKLVSLEFFIPAHLWPVFLCRCSQHLYATLLDMTIHPSLRKHFFFYFLCIRWL